MPTVPPLRARLARPRLGRRRRPDKDPAAIPDPATDAGPRRAARRDRGARWPSTPTAARPRCPALAAAQRVHGWCSPEAIEQVACVMRLTPGLPDRRRDLLRHVRDRRRSGATRVYVCTNISCSLRGADELLRRAAGGRRRRPRRQRARASSASAPATSRRWPRSTASTSGRSSSTTCRRSLDDVRAGARGRCPSKQLVRRPVRRPAAPNSARTRMTEHSSSSDIDEPGLEHARRSTSAAAATRRCARR